MQISAANDSAAFGSRASKFLVMNRTLSYWAQVSGTSKIWYQNAWHTSKVTGTSSWYWYQFLVPETWAENLGRVPWALLVPVPGTRNLGGELGSCAMGLSQKLKSPSVCTHSWPCTQLMLCGSVLASGLQLEIDAKYTHDCNAF